jgi:hypothetical protein
MCCTIVQLAFQRLLRRGCGDATKQAPAVERVLSIGRLTVAMAL